MQEPSRRDEGRVPIDLDDATLEMLEYLLNILAPIYTMLH